MGNTKMKPAKNNEWKIKFETKDGQIEQLSSEGHIGDLQRRFVPMYCNDVLKSPLARIIERWQEPVDKAGN